MSEAKATLQMLIDEFDKHSEYVNGKIERGIEENRKGLFNILLLDVDGNPIESDNVIINQVSHEFKFGAPLFVIDQLDSEAKNEQYKEAFKKLFNYTVLPVYHKDIETEPAVYRFDENSPFIWRRPPLDTIVNFCRENNIGMKAHCLVYNSFNPDWFKGMSNREININIDEYMSAISKRYSKDILDMDVINEMFSIYKNCYFGFASRNLHITDERDHVEKMFTWARKYFPYTKLFWNEGSFETFGNGDYKGFRSRYYLMLKEQLTNNVPIDGVGMQYHLYATQGTKDGDASAYRALCNPLRMIDVLESYSEYNLPIHISEISVPSYSNEQEDEELQAELAKRVYSLFFSSKNVESLVWWNMCDNMAHKSESVFHTGILREDISPKPVYKVLDELINNVWHTKFSTKTKRNGRIEFTGFYGDYDVSFTYGGIEHTKRISLKKENTGFDNRLLAPRTIVVKAE